MARLTFNRSDIEKALRGVGLKRGDIVFSHSNVGYFGEPEAGLSQENLKDTILDPILKLIGPEGTFVVPTFTYSFTKGEVFDVANTRSLCGVLTEIVRKSPGACRSEDPIFSVAAVGARAGELTRDIPVECFGKDSFWDRFYQADGIVMNMNFGAPVTFLHYVEKSLSVPYRYDKLFIGMVRNNGRLYQRKAVYFCRDLANELTRPDWLGLQDMALARGLLRTADVGRGYITAFAAKDLYRLVEGAFKENPFFLTASRNSGKIPEMKRQTGAYL